MLQEYANPRQVTGKKSCELAKATQLVSGREPWPRDSTSRVLLKCKGLRDM